MFIYCIQLKQKTDMKTTKLIFVLLCAVVLMISCGGRSNRHKPVSKKQVSVYYIVIMTDDSLKLAAQTDSLGYCFAVKNLKRGDKIYVSGRDCPYYNPTRTYNYVSSESMLVTFYGLNSVSTLPPTSVPLQKY